MKIVIAPDSFKESLTALEVANAIEAGFKEIIPDAEYVKVPMADGGEGTVQSLVDATNGKLIKKEVIGPLGNLVEAFFGVSGDGEKAFIEMAAASGLHLVPKEQRNPLKTTTYGTGQLILAALDYGAKHIIIGIGGSATNDGGAGMAQAIGAKLLDANGQEIAYGGGSLENLAKIDTSNLNSRLNQIKIEVACDVDNPLTGPKGASAVYGPQKGATSDIVNTLDKNLSHYANVIERDLNKQVKDIPGAGAAGGLGAGLIAFLPVELKSGIDIVTTATKLAEHVENATIVITGEGRIDHQTIYGKTPIGVAKIAKKFNVHVVGIAGSLTKDSEIVHQHGIDSLFSIVPGVIDIEDALTNAADYVHMTSRNIAAAYKFGLSMK